MKFFIDTAEVSEIRAAHDLGLVDGVTTNPSLIAKSGRDFKEVITEITDIVDGPISAEVIALDAEGMLKEGRELAKIHENIVVKVPMTTEGLKATKQFTAEGIKTNVTLIFHPFKPCSLQKLVRPTYRLSLDVLTISGTKVWKGLKRSEPYLTTTVTPLKSLSPQSVLRCTSSTPD